MMSAVFVQKKQKLKLKQKQKKQKMNMTNSGGKLAVQTLKYSYEEFPVNLYINERIKI